MIAGFDAVLVDVRWAVLARDVLLAARRAGIPAILDGDVAPVETLISLAEVADHIIFSEAAARSLGQAKAQTDLVRELSARFPEALVCVTFGADGAYWVQGAELYHQPALQVVAVDTLAAGDAFHGAYALAVAEGLGTADAVRLGSVTAAIKCTIFGGRTGMPLREEAEMALQQLPSSLVLKA